MLKSDKHSRPLSQANASYLNEAEEGGLNLGQVGTTLRRRALLVVGVTGVVATAAVLKAETDPPVYQGKFEILTKSVTGEGKAVSNVPQTLGSQEQGVAAPESVEPVATTIQVLESHLVLDEVVKQLQKKYPELTYDLLIQHLTITSTKQNILEVQYIDPDKKQVTDVLELLATAYKEYSNKERQDDINEGIDFVKKEKTQLQQRVNLWQGRLQRHREKYILVDPEKTGGQLSSQVAVFTQQQLENKVQLEQMQAKYQDLQRELAQNRGERAGNSVLSENVRYQKILDQIQQADIEIKKRSAIFKDTVETMGTVKENKAELLPLLAAEENRVQRDFQSRILELKARDKSLDDKIKTLNGQIKEYAAITRQYTDIERELKIATDGLNQFLTKIQALEIEKKAQNPSWKLLDKNLTEVKKPEAVSDSAKRNLALGGMLGLLLGVGAALVVDKLSNIFYTSKEIKDATGLPLLGVVPLKKELAALANQQNGGMQGVGHNFFFEVFRSLYTNILLLGSDAPIRSLVISSAAQGEGKSTVAVQLALAAAAMGQRVLLVDANLRCPTLHHRVGIMNIQGLTDVIAQDLDWNNVIERSPLEENLYVLAAGPIPPDSIRLLASHKMQDLMDDLQESFDLVIYDTPPVVGFADANLLAANTNGVILVAGLGKLKRTDFQQALEEIQVSGTPVLGVIANKSKDSTPASYSYYQQRYRQTMSAERITDDDAQVKNSVSTSSARRSRRP